MSGSIDRRWRVTCVVAAALTLGGCRQDAQDVRGGGVGNRTLPENSTSAVQAADTGGIPPEGALAQVALGDIAGVGTNALETAVKNPYSGNLAAIKEGNDLFVNMNCAACHGYDLKGGMGPDLTDTYWRYGGSPAAIYKSIYEGRPQGMPSWARALPPAQVWKLVAYVESKGGAFPAALAERAREGDLGDRDTTAGSTMKGRNSVH